MGCEEEDFVADVPVEPVAMDIDPDFQKLSGDEGRNGDVTIVKMRPAVAVMKKPSAQKRRSVDLDTGDKRDDRTKARRFAKLRDAGELRPVVQEKLDEAHRRKEENGSSHLCFRGRTIGGVWVGGVGPQQVAKFLGPTQRVPPPPPPPGATLTKC